VKVKPIGIFWIWLKPSQKKKDKSYINIDPTIKAMVTNEQKNSRGKEKGNLLND
jgi:hypothetical protein